MDDSRYHSDCGDGDYAVCRIESSGNVYVEIGDEIKAHGSRQGKIPCSALQVTVCFPFFFCLVKLIILLRIDEGT